jgi:hypothetical protein
LSNVVFVRPSRKRRIRNMSVNFWELRPEIESRSWTKLQHKIDSWQAKFITDDQKFMVCYYFCGIQCQDQLICLVWKQEPWQLNLSNLFETLSFKIS